MGKPTMRNVDESFHSLTIGAVRSIESARAQRALEGLAEREEQMKIAVSGRAGEFSSWSEVEIEFETVFVNATGQRDSEFTTPHFYYGAYVPVGGPVGLIACVTEWKTNKRDETTGCVIQIGCQSSDVPRKFSGELHAVFQGFGVPADLYDMTNLDVG